MTVGFDLDGTLDQPALRELARTLLAAGVAVHVISGMFPDGQDWQGREAKGRKMDRLGIPWTWSHVPSVAGHAVLHVVEAVPVSAIKDLNYVLRDLGLRKGVLCEAYGIDIFIDDSQTYCEMIPRMSATLALQVRK
jgi:hypothetical protein